MVDPNVLISASISSSAAPARVLQAAEDSEFEMIVSERLLSEVEAALTREKFRRYFSLDAVDNFVLRVRRAATLVEEGEILPVTPDPKDDYLVALARASQADFIVSGDSHLLKLESENLPEILSPRAFLERAFS